MKIAKFDPYIGPFDMLSQDSSTFEHIWFLPLGCLIKKWHFKENLRKIAKFFWLFCQYFLLVWAFERLKTWKINLLNPVKVK